MSSLKLFNCLYFADLSTSGLNYLVNPLLNLSLIIELDKFCHTFQ